MIETAIYEVLAGTGDRILPTGTRNTLYVS
jgi:hypothetical protein